MKYSVGDRLVGDGEPCLIAAEIGENPNGDVELACAMIREAAKAGADAVKFQTITAEELFNPSTPNYARRKRVEMGLSHYPRLMEEARANNLIFFSTPFDEPSADFLDQLGVPLFKLGSGELTHYALLRHVAGKGKTIIISTGMAEVDWIDAAVSVARQEGNDQLIVAHCVSIYPAPLETANIRAIPVLRERLAIPVGFSDHTMSSSAPMAAVSLGACYLEKHFTLSRSLPEGDNDMSLEPHEFKEMVIGVREVEAVLGNGSRSVLPTEKALADTARRSIYARRLIRKGERIDSGAIAVRRPGSQIPADEIDRVLSKIAKEDIAAEEPLRWDLLDV